MKPAYDVFAEVEQALPNDNIAAALRRGEISPNEARRRVSELANTTPTLRVKRLDPDAKLPTYGSAGAACFDLAALHGGEVNPTGRFRTGLAFEVPEGHVMLVFSRSGQGFNNDVRLANCVGVIDSDYRGEVQVKLTADRYHAGGFNVMQGDRIAQAMVLPVQQMAFVEVSELGETERGIGGFGSTGVK